MPVIFDSTSWLGEALAVVLQFVGENWATEQCLLRVQFLAKSLSGEAIARELISIILLSTFYSTDLSK